MRRGGGGAWGLGSVGGARFPESLLAGASGSATAEGALDVAFGVALAFALPLVVLLFSFAQGEQHLDLAVLDVDLERHERVALDLHGVAQLVDLAFVQE